MYWKNPLGFWSSVSYTIPVAGSTAMASWTNLPIAVSGSAATLSSASAGTSKQYPWSRSYPPRYCSQRALKNRSVPMVVSSQVIQDPQGVGPPAQLCSVPPTLTKSRTSSRVFGSTISVVTPPGAVGS